MSEKTETTTKKTVVSGWHEGRKYFMAPDEYTSVAAGKDDTGSAYRLSWKVLQKKSANTFRQ